MWSATRIWLPFLFVLLFALTFLLPAFRLHRATGHWGVTLFDAQTALPHRILNFLIAACGSGLFAWICLYAFMGPDSLSVWPVPGWIAAIGWCCLIVGMAGTVAAQRQMGESWRVGIDKTATALVTRGLFARVRNPIFSALLLAAFGVPLLTPSPWPIAITLALLFSLHLQTRLEERHLASLHGQSYLAYASQVGRFLPGIGKLDRTE